MIAALFVDHDGIYANRDDVDLWPELRDARSYAGPWPVVAHPPCERWGRWWWADGSAAPGNDSGCFQSAMRSVETYGGVIEHPAYSHAWDTFGLPIPHPGGGWHRNLFAKGWSCHIEQRNYGHRARKATWLYYVGDNPPPMMWGRGTAPEAYLCRPGRTKTFPGRADVTIMGSKEARATPRALADMLILLAAGSVRVADTDQKLTPTSVNRSLTQPEPPLTTPPSSG